MTENVTIEIEYFGDELDVVIHKEGKTYLYALADHPELVEIINRLRASGTEVIDNTVEGDYTTYAQFEEY